MKKEDLSYIAGFIDGEGCISSIFTKYKGTKYARIIIRVGNTDRSVLDFIRNFFQPYVGGVAKVCECNIKTSGRKKRARKRYFLYTQTDKKAYLIIKKLYPYLKIKKKQAELCINFFEDLKRFKGYEKEKINMALKIRKAVKTRVVEENL